ncbi:hypothetical protein V5O48_013480 [Marasmius crinis-equi]|uniref:CxC2-like cysteine cluster KDZ transposase-associated domain-containing protein n=1 Tax=Marasmius crinis-equi TaxID=585013 RepID=A0ABR3EZY9_9AGAR
MAPERTNARKPPSQTGYISIPSISSNGRRVKQRLVPVSLPPHEPILENETTFPPLPTRASDFMDFTPDDLPIFQPAFEDDMDDDEAMMGLQRELEGEEDEQEIPDGQETRAYQVPGSSGRVGGKEDPLRRMQATAREMLQLMVTLEGRCGSQTMCSSCSGEEDVSYRCRACYGHAMFCKSCLVGNHRSQPFDHIEKWNGFYFERVTLHQLGLRVQVGHAAHETCRNRRPARSGFCIVDIDSIQEIELDFCQCQAAEIVGDSWKQLMQARLFPATLLEPRTAFTFRMLEFFHAATLQSKMTVYDVCQTIQRRTDGAGVADSKSRYHELLRVIRVWRYLKQLKRGGIACQPARDLADIRPGELALRCPACPRPNINLPVNWEIAENGFIYRKFLAVDACFRLKRRAVSSEAQDPGLMTGKSYFVPQAQYQEMMANEPVQVEESGCEHSMAAVDQASTKFSKGYATTGVVLCLCARHEIVEPNGVVDTNKGEKYWHADYAISSSQTHSDSRLSYVLSYDINCRYSKRFFIRLDEDLPEEVKCHPRKENWQFVIPKLHIQGHGWPCQEVYSFYLLPGAGETDGEGIERQWADLGGVAGATKEMAPGGRRDTIDDHLGDWSHRKVIALGELLCTRRRKAREQAEAQRAIFVEFTKTQSEYWPQLAQQVLLWEQSKSDFNPYSAGDIRDDTEATIRLQLAKEEAEEARAGLPSVHEVSPSAFMVTVLELEELQRRLCLDLKDKKWKTEIQQTELVERRAKISRQVSRVRALQLIYTPIALEAFPPSTEPSPTPEPEEVSTLLPSSLPSDIRPLPVLQKWVAMEIKFRQGQIASSLDAVRRHIFVRTRLHSQRSIQVRHQHASVRARQVLARNERKLLEAKMKYRAAWKALEALLGQGNVPFRYLDDKDCVAFHDPHNDALKKRRNKRKQQDTLFQPGETRKQVSWIWTGVDIGGDSQAMQDALRIEWCKAQARTRRWSEELELLEEEMRRIPILLEAEARQWLSWIVADADSYEAEGINAYCCRQAAIRRSLSQRFQNLWAKPDPPRRKQDVVLPELSDLEDSSESDDEGDPDSDDDD